MRHIRNIPTIVIGSGTRAVRLRADDKLANHLISRALGKLPRRAARKVRVAPPKDGLTPDEEGRLMIELARHYVSQD